ncbi:MAG: tetratricopeptide repeat protein, partial [Mangrovimonas sp.]|nr:tetratricopeptide repeat protein [Mangrovimonas sp.]
LANVYMLSKNYDAAEQIYTTVIPVYQDVFGTNSSKVFEIKNNYAALLTITKKYTEAETLYLNLETDFANKNSLLDNETTVLYFNIANVFYAEDKLPEAIQYYRKFLDVYIQKINSDFTFLSESEKQNYLLANEEKYHYLMNFYHNLSDKTPVLDDIFRLQSSFRGMILQSSVDIKKKWKTSENPELSKLLSDWEKNQKLKNSYQFEGNNDEAIKTQFILDELEREMSRKIPDYASLSLVGNINWKELQSGLQSNEVL